MSGVVSASSAARNGRLLLGGAALLHVVVVLALFAFGRAGIAPHLVDRDGIVAAAAVDGYAYRQDAVRLLDTWRAQGVAAWAHTPERPHVRLLSIAFALLAPSVGYGVLAAEAINLPCYLAIVALVAIIGREVGGRRVGLGAAAVVALWPTLLVHTTQFLKDPLFIAGALVLVLVVTTWLTRTYGPREAVAAAAALGLGAALLLVRSKFLPVVVALALVGLVLLVVRQLVERRALPWNLACALALTTLGMFALAHESRTIRKTKAYPAPPAGPSKSVDGPGRLKASRIEWRADAAGDGRAPVARAVAALGSLRGRYNSSNDAAGSGIDADVELRDAADVVRYLPRAAQIGWWAPFPNAWLGVGTRVGRAGRVLAGIETAAIYLCEALALVAVAIGPRRAPALLLLGVSAIGLTAMGLVVSNVGTLYRFRYTFWILLVVLGATGLEKLTMRRAR